RIYVKVNKNISDNYDEKRALNILQPMIEDIYERVCELTEHLRNGLDEIPGVKLMSPTESKSGITLFTGRNVDDILSQNISVNYRAGIRVSPHFYNTEAEINRLLNCL